MIRKRKINPISPSMKLIIIQSLAFLIFTPDTVHIYIELNQV